MKRQFCASTTCRWHGSSIRKPSSGSWISFETTRRRRNRLPGRERSKMTSNAIVQKLWNYCNILRDDGLSYQDYLEQLTFLLFLKMADERQKLFPTKTAHIPPRLDWQSLERLDGEDLDTHYRHILIELGKKPGMLGT